MGKNKKKILDQEFEKLDAMATPGKKGVEDAKSILKENDKEEQKLKDTELTILTDVRSKKAAYIKMLALLLLKKLKEAELPWGYEVALTDKGVVLELTSPQGRIFRSAFKAIGVPGFDLNAVELFVIRTENTIERLTNGQRSLS